MPCTDDGVRLAAWGWRFLAILIDSIIVGVVVVLLTFPIWSPLIAEFMNLFREAMEAARQGVTTTPPPPDFVMEPRMTFLLGLAQVIIGVAYNAVFLRLKGATPGKLMCGLRVVPLQQGRFAGRLEWNTCLVRALVWVVPGISAWTWIFRVADAIVPLTNPRQQAIHDMIAKTQVIRP